MKLSIGGLAALLTLAMTMPAIGQEAKTPKFVKYQFVVKMTAANKPGQVSDITATMYEDLPGERLRMEAAWIDDGTQIKELAVFDMKLLISLNATAMYPVKGDVKSAGEAIHIERKTYKTRDDLVRESELAGLLTEVAEMTSDKKRSVTSETTLDGKPALKVVHRRNEKITTTIWLDPATKLPVRIEKTDSDRDGRSEVKTGFEWDPAIEPDALFSTGVRNGYWVLPKDAK